MPRPTATFVCAAVLAGIGLAACGSGSSAPPGPESSSTTGATAPTTAEVPGDMTEALAQRLAEEWDDADLADEIVGRLDPALVADLEALIPLQEVATTPLLSYRTDPVDLDEVDSLLVFSFGLREEPDGTRTPGPVNEALARAVAEATETHPVPVYAQWEVAQVLTGLGAGDVVSIAPEIAPDGTETYLSTAGVAEQAAARADAAGTALGRVGVAGFVDHVGRCLLTVEDLGLDAAVADVEVPTEYDPASSQPWTRDRATYLGTDLGARLSLLTARGGRPGPAQAPGTT